MSDCNNIMEFVLSNKDVRLVHIYPAIPYEMDVEIEKLILPLATLHFKKISG